MTLDYDFLYKVMMFGDSGVGKSSLVLRLNHDDFSSKFQPTIGIEFSIKDFQVGSKKIKVQIWDTAGVEKYRTVTSGTCYKTVGILLVYSITDRSSFLNVENYLKYCRDRTSSDVVMILIGNKSDLECQRVVTTEEAKKFADKNKLVFMETSALHSTNVETAFFNISVEILSKSDPENSAVLRPIISSKQKPKLNDEAVKVEGSSTQMK